MQYTTKGTGRMHAREMGAGRSTSLLNALYKVMLYYFITKIIEDDTYQFLFALTDIFRVQIRTVNFLFYFV